MKWNEQNENSIRTHRKPDKRDLPNGSQERSYVTQYYRHWLCQKQISSLSLLYFIVIISRRIQRNGSGTSLSQWQPTHCHSNTNENERGREIERATTQEEWDRSNDKDANLYKHSVVFLTSFFVIQNCHILMVFHSYCRLRRLLTFKVIHKFVHRLITIIHFFIVDIAINV